MQLHQARTADLSHKKKVRVGRGPGSGLGKTAGRGIKGATSRSGYAMKVTYEGGQMPIFRRLPKRGFTNGPFRRTFAVVNLGELSDFQAGSQIGPDEIRRAGLVMGSPSHPLKILGDGELTVALNIRAHAFSKSALEKIQKAGGKAEWIDGAPKKPAPDFKKLEAEKKRAEAAKKAEGAPKDAKSGKPGGASKPEKAKAEGAAPKQEKAKAEGGDKKPEKAKEANAEPKGPPEAK